MKAFNVKKIDGETLRGMLISGANNLFNHYPEVDALNVFPVPDGDTGTNMNLTMTSGSKEIMTIRSNNISEVAKLFSRGLLMGARGNSGVILSQIFRGFSQALEGQDEIDVVTFARAWEKGREVAYKAVMKPVEGTILTVVRESSEALMANVENFNSIGKGFAFMIEEARKSLVRTPDLLPILKEAGVVDSGGAGLIKVFEGMLSSLNGILIERQQITIQPEKSQSAIATAGAGHEEFGYCTEFILKLEPGKKPYNEEKFKVALESLGDSLVLVRDEDIVKVHVHTMRPGVALNYAQSYGEFVTLKIENMTEQHQNIITHEYEAFNGHAKVPVIQESKEVAIIAVSVGKGLDDLFHSLRVDKVVSGGQSMNPSTEDFVAAIQEVNARNVFILPNNRNIILAANQSVGLVEGVNVVVIPSKTIPQGMSACMMYNPDASFQENETEMIEAITRVKSGAVTFAIKNSKLGSVTIKKNDFIGILESNIVSSEKDVDESARKLIASMIDEDSAIITLIYGQDITKEQAKNLATYIEDTYSIEVETYNGGQLVYSYILGVE